MKYFKDIAKEFLNLGIGWILGLISVQLVQLFFEEKGIMNLWGFWSDKMVVEGSTLSVIEWLASAVIGYVVMQHELKEEDIPKIYIKKNKHF